ncbi:MAG TPA: RdgB/HAM1 family non-canonical purine NTP pyrophosphatase [Stellaceae bacterium]|nr:RdgB/HAM1 family non-canonical purine NTP pyrophosphatase [Stellaceae bacterium]
MARKFEGDALVLATHNKGKLREIAALMAPFQVRVTAAGDLGLPEPEETGTTFIENAVLKAQAAAGPTGLPALADDSGMVVPALDGAPGLYSARWAGPDKDFGFAMARVERELAERELAGREGATGSTDRRAAFVSALALAWPDGHVESFEGRIEGRLVFPPRGTLGFGYDPIFMPDGYDQTFGELDPAVKHRIGHRARAFNQLVEACFRR